MTIVLTATELNELYAESRQQTLYSTPQDPFAVIWKMPEAVGKGICQNIELYPDLCLSISHRTWQDHQIKMSESADHPIQLGFMLSGKWVDSNGGQLSPSTTMISGSGMQHRLSNQASSEGLEVCVEIFMSPDRLKLFFPDASGELPAELNFLVRGNDWQTLIYPQTTGLIQRTVQEIVTCPFQGFQKRLYLQTKVHELIGLQLLSVLQNREALCPAANLKPSTIERIYYAKNILLTHLEQPPSPLELAQQVGLSDRTLRKGFQEVFGTSIVKYLTQKRMEQAEQLLRNNTTVAEVANRMGYSHLGHSAAAFKHQFGITPYDCLHGKKSVAPRF